MGQPPPAPGDLVATARIPTLEVRVTARTAPYQLAGVRELARCGGPTPMEEAKRIAKAEGHQQSASGPHRVTQHATLTLTMPKASTPLRMRTLLVLRHAKSSRDEPARDDHERPLNTRGLRDGPHMGELLREHGLLPDLVISSDAVRARVTAQAVAKSAGYAGDILLDPRLYLASPADILSLLQSVRGNAETVMIVGHNPGLEELVEQLTGEPQDLPTAALVQIVLPIDQWRDLRLSVRGTLAGCWRPKERPLPP